MSARWDNVILAVGFGFWCAGGIASSDTPTAQVAWGIALVITVGLFLVRFATED